MLRGHRKQRRAITYEHPRDLEHESRWKPHEHDFRREHCISRESPGYYFGERVLLPECSRRWPWSDVFSTWTSPTGLHQQRDAGFSFRGKDNVLYKTTTRANGLLPRTRRRNHPTRRPPIKSTDLEISSAPCPADREKHHLLRLPFVGVIGFRFCLLVFRIALF